MNKFWGVLLWLVALVLGFIATVNLLALISVGIDGELDVSYALMRAAIVFVTGYFTYKSFTSGKSKLFAKSE